MALERRRLWLGLAGLGGATAVAIAAFSAHRLPGDRQLLADRGVEYQLIHALALLAIAAMPIPRSRWLDAAGALFVLGMIGFSGGIYGDALLGWGPTPLIPMGGTAYILGWLAALAAALAT